MSSKFDMLLANDDRYKLSIYQMLQSKKEGDIALIVIKQQINLSGFKFTQLLEELEYDLKDLKSTIFIGDKYLRIRNLSYHDYQMLQLMYFKRSVAADFLIKVGLLESITVSEFAELHFLSSSSVYNVQSDVNKSLESYDLVMKNSHIEGAEKSIRSLYFQILFNYYGGIESPFPNSVKQIVEDYVTDMEPAFVKKLTMVQRAQLDIFLGIQFLRVQNGFYIESSPKQKMDQVDDFFNTVEPRYSSSKIPAVEGEYLFLYLVLNGYLESTIKQPVTMLEKLFVQYLEDKINLSYLNDNNEIIKAIHTIAQRWYYYQLSTSTFIDIDEFEKFSKTSPHIHELVFNFTSNLGIVDGHPMAEAEKNYLYYEFMVRLLSISDIQKYEPVINIFVDFSSGRNYSRFISDDIRYFGFLNINVMSEITDQTDIYISDFSNSKVDCLQVIWKGAPQDRDWEELSEAIIDVKSKK